ncbi:MAG: hypothetical protein HYR72_03415 [Deltaproteobacteria bacterium]|nr:hypothetical protein [Deltaproteobacteria bacterium]MBI3388977.1 hypothetical protein [Deltaproteobacteria bacterium]
MSSQRNSIANEVTTTRLRALMAAVLRALRAFVVNFHWHLLTAVAFSCVPPPAEVPRAQPNAAARFTTVLAREEQITSLRARFTAESRRGDERHTTTGVLLVKKPDRFRLRMLLPIGFTVFDYVRTGAHSQVSLPLEDRVIVDPPPDGALPFSQADFAEAFLRGQAAFPGACAPSSSVSNDHGAVIVCREAGQIVREIRLDASAATIREETSYEAGQPRMIIGYDDYREIDGVALPFHITMRYPARDLAVDIAVQRYEVNPALRDDLFRLAAP